VWRFSFWRNLKASFNGISGWSFPCEAWSVYTHAGVGLCDIMHIVFWFFLLKCIISRLVYKKIQVTDQRVVIFISLTLKSLKRTPLRSGRATHLKRNFSFVFLLSMCIGYKRLSCGTLICLFLVGNSFKTCIISVDLGKAFQF